MADEFPKLKRPAFILVMGLPHSGSHALSCSIAGWAKCPWVKHEVILDSLSEEAAYHIDNLPSEEDAARLHRLSFHITSSTALFQLSYASPTEGVFISSELVSYKSQLLGLLNILQRNLSVGRSRRLLIIDCLRKNKFLWQRYADKKHHQETPWYEPRSWKDVEKAVLDRQQEGIDDCFLTLLQDTPPTRVDAIKLVLDPQEDLTPRDFVTSEVLKLDRRSLFIEAIKDLLTCDDVNSYGDGSHVVDYPLWRRQRLDELGRSFAARVTTQHHWCSRRGDCIFRLTHNLSQQVEEEEATCEICDGRIQSKERAYYCQFCSLSFHQACCCAYPTITAEILSQVLDLLKYHRSRFDEVFPETHACYSCIREDKGFSGTTCDSCVYRTSVKSRVLSPILRHPCDQDHILTMSLAVDSKWAFYGCTACGLNGNCNTYYCNICSSTYHMECLHLPLEREHQHGGHLHRMKMEFSCPKEEEYEWCLACYKDIDPQTWVYTCQECDYVAHLYCLFPFLQKKFSSSLG